MGSAIYGADNYFSKFDPRIYQMTGCRLATLISGTLEYWFGKKNDQFYKFIEPCGHRLYKEGDSWLDELGCNRKSFANAFDKIGLRHKSRTAFENAEDKFEGKMYASYYDRLSHCMQFVRNHELADRILRPAANAASGASKKVVCAPAVNDRYAPAVYARSLCTKNTTKNTTKTTSSLPTLSQEVGDVPEGLVRSEEVSVSPQVENSQDIHKSPSEGVEASKAPTCRQIHEQMLLAFNKHTGWQVARSTSLDEKAVDCFANEFGNSMEEWEKYCVMISQNDFEMGKTVTRKPYRLYFSVAITPEKIEKIREKHAFRVEAPTTKVEDSGTSSISSLTSGDVEDKIDASDEPELVKQIRKEILSEFGLNSYKSWFDNSQQIRTTMKVIDDKLLLTVEGLVTENHIKDMYGGMFRNILAKHGLSLSIVSAAREQAAQTQVPRQVLKEDYDDPADIQDAISVLFKTPFVTSPPKCLNPNDEDIEAKKASFLQAYGLPSNYCSPKLYGRRA